MSIQNKGISCALCHAYLFDEDDVVYCPECGAPHHRECYNSIGKCALETFHGTENQYDKVKRAMEEQEKADKESEQEKAEPQTEENFETPFGFAPVDFLGGVKPDTVIEDGVTAKEAARFVMSNTMRYIPKFARGRKASWNFLAFLTPCGWFLSRKMYKIGIIAGALQLISSLLTLPYQNVLINLGITGSMYSPEFAQSIAQNIDKFSPLVILALLIGGLISSALSVLSGIFGDWLYRKHVVDTVREIKQNSEDIEADFRKKGGINFFLFFVGLFGLQYILTFIAAFI